MEKRKLPFKIALSYTPVLFVFIIALVIKQPAIITGGGEIPYAFFIAIFWPLSSIISCLFQGKLRTKWMWLAPFVIVGLWVGLHFQDILRLPAYISWMSVGILSLAPSLLGLFLGFILAKRKKRIT